VTPAPRRPGELRAFWLAPLLGALQTLAFVHTALWPLPLLAMAALVALLERAARPVSAAVLAWLFGLGWLVAGTWWLFISMHRYGGLAAPLAVLAVLALAAALSLYLAAAGWVCGSFAHAPHSGRAGVFRRALLFAALWLAAELCRGVLFTGFPWVASGYSQIDGPLALLAPWVGVYGMGFVLALLAGLLAAPGLATRWRALGVAALGAAALLPASLWRGPDFTQPHGQFNVSLVQTNVAQDQKFSAEHLPQALAFAARALTQAPGPLVVGPETVVPLLPAQLHELDPGYWPALQAHFNAPGRAALIGIPLGDFDTGYTNTVLGLAASAEPPYRYDKHHLVPFGEFIPWGFRWFTQLMNIPLGDFARGRVDAPSFEVMLQGTLQRLAPNICYEDLFGEELAVRFSSAAHAPTVLVNHSNIGWFGHSIAVPQHLNISRLRSLELQRPMLRATNTGATAIVNHRGEVQALLEPFTRGVLNGPVQGRSGNTPYAAWAAHVGLWPLWALAVLLVLGALWFGRGAVTRAAGPPRPS
jgi:apolipoprotein N-acyltransferase